MADMENQGGLVKLDPAGLSKLKQVLGEAGKGFPMPYVREIFLLECRIAGTMHVEEIGRKTAGVTEGTLLQFLREESNKVDSLAIQILNEQGERIGYVPREKNEVLARLMDAGKLIFGQVVSKEKLGDWTKIIIRVLMKDV